MRYIVGQLYESDPIEPSQATLRHIDYYVPTYDDNLHYLKLLNTESLPLFEVEFTKRTKEKLLYEQHKKDPKFYSVW